MSSGSGYETSEFIRRINAAAEQLHADVMAMGVVRGRTLKWKGNGWRGPSVNLKTEKRFGGCTLSLGFDSTWLPDRVADIGAKNHMRIDQLSYVVRNWAKIRTAILKAAQKLPQQPPPPPPPPPPCHDKACGELLEMLDEQLQ